MGGPGKDHGALVPAFGHHPAVSGQMAQPLFDPPAHQGPRRQPGGLPGHRRGPEVLAHLDAVDHQVKSPGIGGHLRGEVRQELRQGRVPVQVQTQSLGLPGHGPIEGAAVQVEVTQGLGQEAAHRAFAGPGRTVDGDDAPRAHSVARPQYLF